MLKISEAAATRITELAKRYEQADQAQEAANDALSEYIHEYMKKQDLWDSLPDVLAMYRKLPRGAPVNQLLRRYKSLAEQMPAAERGSLKPMSADVDEELKRLVTANEQLERERQDAGKELDDFVREYMIEHQMWDAQGGVSVYLAKEYGVTVDGYDLLQGFIDRADEYAKEHNVQSLCNFFAADVRDAIDAGKEYDLVLWSAPPHLWDNFQQTVENLRKCVKPGGYLVIADAYLYTDEGKSVAPDYETLEEITQSATDFGDRIESLLDYKDSLWAANYQTDREAVMEAIKNADNQREKELLQNYLDGINDSQQSDTESMGLYILVLEVKK